MQGHVLHGLGLGKAVNIYHAVLTPCFRAAEKIIFAVVRATPTPTIASRGESEEAKGKGKGEGNTKGK